MPRSQHGTQNILLQNELIISMIFMCLFISDWCMAGDSLSCLARDTGSGKAPATNCVGRVTWLQTTAAAVTGISYTCTLEVYQWLNDQHTPWWHLSCSSKISFGSSIYSTLSEADFSAHQGDGFTSQNQTFKKWNIESVSLLERRNSLQELLLGNGKLA